MPTPSTDAEATRVAVFPGSFFPPTVAHLAISEAVRAQRHVTDVVWSISVAPLGKDELDPRSSDDRLAVLQRVAGARPWLTIQVTEARLLVDIAEGYDVLILGADKWHQIQELGWYGNDEERRDEMLSRLPELAIAPRPPFEVPPLHALDISGFETVSSTAARSGEHELMLPEAVRSGIWSR